MQRIDLWHFAIPVPGCYSVDSYHTRHQFHHDPCHLESNLVRIHNSRLYQRHLWQIEIFLSGVYFISTYHDLTTSYIITISILVIVAFISFSVAVKIILSWISDVWAIIARITKFVRVRILSTIKKILLRKIRSPIIQWVTTRQCSGRASVGGAFELQPAQVQRLAHKLVSKTSLWHSAIRDSVERKKGDSIICGFFVQDAILPSLFLRLERERNVSDCLASIFYEMNSAHHRYTKSGSSHQILIYFSVSFRSTQTHIILNSSIGNDPFINTLYEIDIP